MRLEALRWLQWFVQPALLVVLAFCTILNRPAEAAGSSFDYCSAGQRTSLFVVDRTTRFDRTDEDILVAAADAFAQAQIAGERVIVAAVSGAYTEIRLVMNECRPGCPDENFLSRLVSTCRPVIARGDYVSFERRFITVLMDLLKNQEEAPASDLYRSIAEVTRLVGANGYRPLRQVVFYSDLLEASQLLPGGQIRRLQPSETIRKLAANKVEAHLDGASFRVVGFGRDDAPKRPPLNQDVRRRVEESWRSWLSHSGASNVQIGLR
jgi:hypothetical protein